MGTCEWVLSSEEWLQWEQGIRNEVTPTVSQGLWISGIPGSGKTILSSFLATEIMAMRDHQARVATAYYYCHHSHNHDETSHFLAWLLNQLGGQAKYVPQHIIDLFQRGCLPRPDELIDAIKMVAARFSQVLVSIDAIDESQRRENLAKLLKSLATQHEFGAFHILATGRDGVDIERHLGGFICMSMSNWFVHQDIMAYIDGQFQEERAFQGWSTGLRKVVKQHLCERADGMFRLVVCQLDMLRKIPLESEVRKALQHLPDTIDDMYERILINIPLESRHIARRALRYLLCVQILHGDERCLCDRGELPYLAYPGDYPPRSCVSWD